MTTRQYDLVVIGSGPAGEKGAAQAAYFGKKVAVVERREFGGATANSGTLPSKTLRETAVFLSGFRHRELEGLDLRGLSTVKVNDFLARSQVIKNRERSRVQANFERHGIDVYFGDATLSDAQHVVVRAADGETTSLSAGVILIATGSFPYRPADFNFDDSRVYDSDSILEMDQLPSSMIVVGGGVIGCEYACVFAELGIELHLVERREHIVDFLDAEFVSLLTRQMETIGIRFYMGDRIASIQYAERLEVELASGARIAADAILASAGRSGCTQGLGLEALGIELDARGRIQVNEHYQTRVRHIYAAGDVIGNPALASTSMQQARLAMVHAFNLEYLKQLPAILPYGIYTIPECAMAGETEESLARSNVPYVVGRATYESNARGQIVGDLAGLLKLIFDPEDMRLLGVHVLGEQATELVHVGLTALLTSAGAELFLNTCYNYPTLTELYKYATYDALDRRQKQRTAK